MEKYNQKKAKKNRRKLKSISFMFLTIFLVLQLYMLDTRLRQSTSTNEKSIYEMSFNKDTLDLELFGNKYHISGSELNKILKNLKVTVKNIKDQMSLVF